MFTGIVEKVGRIAALEPRGEVIRLWIEAGDLAAELPRGASVAVNGACLTAVETTASRVAFDAVRETLERTSTGQLGVGAAVNLERALRADGRLDGHLVQGHVDTKGRVVALDRRGEDVSLRVACGEDFAVQLIPKGSIAVDGVSLTLVEVADAAFSVALIPHTLRETNLDERRPGDPVNLEADLLGKYVRRYLERAVGAVRGA